MPCATASSPLLDAAQLLLADYLDLLARVLKFQLPQRQSHLDYLQQTAASLRGRGPEAAGAGFAPARNQWDGVFFGNRQAMRWGRW